MGNLRAWVALLACLLAVSQSGCDTPQAFSEGAAPGGGADPGGGGSIDFSQYVCTDYEQDFNQPTTTVGSLDLLFMTDTSGSLDDERSSIADGIDAFVAKLPSSTDYNIGVMMAHSPLSSYSGKLWAKKGNPKVIESHPGTGGAPSLADIRSQLKDNLTNLKSDSYSDGGEEGMVSLLNALTPANLSESRNLHFFRDGAALAVIFISDENDICAKYPAGVTPVYDPDKIEPVANARDCKGITAEGVVSAVKTLQGDRPYSFAAVVYTGETPVPPVGENEIGYGYLDVIKLSNGDAVDLALKPGETAAQKYSAGLEKIGDSVSRSLTLILRKALDHPLVNPASVRVTVDGAPAKANFNAATGEVQLLEPGHSGSAVAIRYSGSCVLKVVPTPTPAPSPTPAP